MISIGNPSAAPPVPLAGAGAPAGHEDVDFGLELSSLDAGADPHPLLHRMRHEEPVHYSPTLWAWIFTRYDDVIQGFRDPRLAGDRTKFLIDVQLGARDRSIVGEFERIERGMMINKEGSEHLRLRRLVQHGFTPARLAAARPRIEQAVDGLLDRAAASGRLEVVAEYAEPLPTQVICALMGIPLEDGPTLREWSEKVGRFRGRSHADIGQVASEANIASRALYGYFLELIEQRRRQPGDDLISVLVAGHEEGRLSAQEVSSQCQLLFGAGHQTVLDQLGNAVHALLSHPEQLRELQANPSLIGPAVEEVLRYDPSVAFMNRVAGADLELRGQVIREGEVVFLGIAAANRDPEVFADPNRFDIHRPGRPHLTFATGPHACLGMGLARLELEVALLTLFRQFPRLRLDPDAPPRRRRDTLFFHGFDVLPTLTA
jgi:cytochrome P450 PksS